MLSFVDVALVDDSRTDFYAMAPLADRRCALIICCGSDHIVMGFDDPAHTVHLYCRSVSVSALTDGAIGDAQSVKERVSLFLRRVAECVGRCEARAQRLGGFGDGMEFVLHIHSSDALNLCARSAGLLGVEEEVLEEVSLHFAPACLARSFVVASLAVMMAGHGRLGSCSALGSIGVDCLRMICDAYRLRLFESRDGVW